MKIHSIIVAFFLLIFLSTHSYGQPVSVKSSDNNIRRDSSCLFIKQQLAPVGLISGSILIESLGIKKDIQDWFPRTNTTVENYLRDVPVVMFYGSDFLGCKHRNNVINQTIYFITSRLVTGYLTGALKRATKIARPDGSGNDAFPSGHTSEAFVSATFLYRETKDYEPVLAYSGFLFSSATGVLRITNNKHWISDVLFGAGLGMLVTNIVYSIDPLKNWDPLRLNKKAAIIPDIDVNSHTYCLSIIIPMD